MARWSEDTTLKFVKEYVLHECLWNFKDKNYRNKQVKQQAVSKIITAMEIPNFGPKEVDLKIKSIRSTYSQELKKIKASETSGAGMDSLYKPNVKWFTILHDPLKSVNIAEARNTQGNMVSIVLLKLYILKF